MTTLTKEELEKLVAVTQMVADMADGLDMAAEVEVLVINGLDKYAALFQADDRDPKTMRALRVYNEAKSNHRRFVKDAYALRTLAAENTMLRASEAAALERVKTLAEALRAARPRIVDMARSWEAEAQLLVKIDAALTPTADKEPKT